MYYSESGRNRPTQVLLKCIKINKIKYMHKICVIDHGYTDTKN
jgi:hypothetical protein